MSLLTLICLIVLCGTALSEDTCQQKKLATTKAGGPWRGTNLGSWFVLESWMASYIWDKNGCDKDKYQGSYMVEHCLGSKAKDVMEKHWASWITEADFIEIASHGINIVRIPVGWWHIYDPEGGADKAKLHYDIKSKDYVAGGLQYLDKAFEWGAKHGVGIIIDMHAATGSQNGNDNSSPPALHEKDWGKYPQNQNQTVDSMELYAQRYGSKEALMGFCLLNEPFGQDHKTLESYYMRAYAAIRKHSKDTWILIDAMGDPNFMSKKQGYTKVGLDAHFYSCFGGEADQKNASKAIEFIKTHRKNEIKSLEKNNDKPLIIGEWSACIHTDATSFPDFFKVQVETYNTAQLGWTFWSWTDQGIKEGPSCFCEGKAWSMKTAVRNGWAGNFTTPCPK